MPKTGARRRQLERTQKAKKVRPSAPLLETRARTILETMVEEVADAAPAGLTLPEVPEPILAAPEPASAEVQSIDELATRDLVTIVKNGGSLEVDGSRYTSDELELLAENVTGRGASQDQQQRQLLGQGARGDRTDGAGAGDLRLR